MDKVRSHLTGNLLARWQKLAEQATAAHQLILLPGRFGENITTSLYGKEGVRLANGLTFEDGLFFAEARTAVLQMSRELSQLEAYIQYVDEVVDLAGRLISSGAARGLLPMTYEEWLENQEKEGE